MIARALIVLLLIIAASAFAAENSRPKIPPLPITVHGRSEHPSIYVTKQDFVQARQRIHDHPWAKKAADELIRDAGRWLTRTDAETVALLPPPNACYAYGFAGCPVCGAKLPTLWGAAPTCSLDDPGHVKCIHGHRLPDADHPDSGTGWTDKTGKKFYFVGAYNAFVIDTLTVALDKLVLAYGLTEDPKYGERAALILDHLAALYPTSETGSWDYPSTPPSGRFNRPWYQVARMLIHYAHHYDVLMTGDLLNAPSSKDGLTRRKNIEDNLLLNGALYCYLQAATNPVLNNGEADYQRGQMVVAAAMGIPEYMAFAVDGPFGFRNMVEDNIDRDGQYYETSSGYSHHARYLYMDMAEILKDYRDDAHPTGYDVAKNPKFRAAFLSPRMKLDAAGFLPTLGDDSPNVTTRPSARLARASDAVELEHLAAVIHDPSVLNAIPDLDAARSTGQADWLLFHAIDVPAPSPSPGTPGEGRGEGRSAQHEVRATTTHPSPASDLLPQRGLAILRSGTGAHQRAATLRAGPTLNHGHFDELHVNLYAHGQDLTYDVGYGLGSTHTQVGWAHTTASHNTVLVDETPQLVAGRSGGTIDQFVTLPGFSLLRATDPACYASEKLTRYDRTLAMVDLNANESYLVDLFHVTGGHQHDYLFHARGTHLTTENLALGEPAKGSLAGETIAWGDHLGADGDVLGIANKPYWNPPPGNGLGFLMRPRSATPSADPFSATWEVTPDAHLKLTMLPFQGLEVLTADAPGIYPHLPRAAFLIARHKQQQRQGGPDPLDTTYAAVLEPYAKSPTIESISALPPGGATSVASSSTAIKIQLPDNRTDYVLHTDAPTNWTDDTLTFRLDQGTAVVTTHAGAVTTVTLVGGSSITAGDLTARADRPAYTAQLTRVDPATSTLYTDAPLPTGPELAGQYLTVGRDTYSHRSAYRIDRVARENNQTAIHLAPTSLLLARGHLAGAVKGNVLPNVVPLEYAKSVRHAPSGFFRGKRLTTPAGAAETTITDVADNEGRAITVDHPANFHDGDDVLIYDAQPGDDVRIPTVLHLQKTASDWSPQGSNAPVQVR